MCDPGDRVSTTLGFYLSPTERNRVTLGTHHQTGSSSHSRFSKQDGVARKHGGRGGMPWSQPIL